MKQIVRRMLNWCLVLFALAAICPKQTNAQEKRDVYFGTLKELDQANRILYMDVINVNRRVKGNGVIAFHYKPDLLVNIELPDRTFQKDMTVADLANQRWLWLTSTSARDFYSVNATVYQSFRGIVQDLGANQTTIKLIHNRIGARQHNYSGTAQPENFQLAASVPYDYKGLPTSLSEIRPGMEVNILTRYGTEVVKVTITDDKGISIPQRATPSPVAVPTATTPPLTIPSVPASPAAIVPPPSGLIAFHSNRDGNDEIYTMRLDGTLQRRLTNNLANDGGALIRPDGKQIAFTSNRDGNLEVYVMDADGSSQTRLTSHIANDIAASWSPSSEYLAFYSNRNGNYDLFITDVQGMMLNSLTESSRADDIEPAFSPDGQRLAFSTKRDGNFEIYTCDINGKKVQRLTSSPLPDMEPIWSPDGKQIVWSRREGERNENIFIMNSDGSGQKCLTDYNGKDVKPSFSADGQKIIFASDRNGNMEIYAMELNGAGVTRLTENLASDLDPQAALALPVTK